MSKRNRLAMVFIGVSVCFAALIFRLMWIQLVRGGELSQKAMDIRTRDEVLEPVRGIIYDRNHNELVTNAPVKSVYANPDIFSVKAGEGVDETQYKEMVMKEIASALQLDEAGTVKTLSSGQQFAWLKRRVDYDTCLKLEGIINQYKVTGIGFVDGTRRFYPQGGMAAHLLGFVGIDPSARSGIEKSYDQELSGIPGRLVAETDAGGRVLPQTRSEYIPPVPGNNLVLTIDSTIQHYVERELDNLEEKYKPSRALILVMDPATGEVLAMGARPSFDPANYSQYPQSVWNSDPLLQYNYEPGSTLKMFVAAMALEEGVVSEDTRFSDPGYIVVSGRRIKCWYAPGHGDQSFAEGVQNSCNPVFISTGLKAGKSLYYKYITGFGFGSPTGIDLPGEESGLMIPEEKATTLDLATMSIGQSIAVTPIQLVTAMSALANGGQLMKPHLVRAVEDSSGNVVKSFEPQVVRQVVSKNTADRVTRLLERVVMLGSGKRAYVDGYSVAGKTGTAEIPDPEGYKANLYVSSFAGFVPSDNPRLAILVVLAEAKGPSYYGGEIAAPVFRAVARDSLHYLNVPENPDLPRPKITVEDEVKPVPEGGGTTRVPDLTGFPVEEARQFLVDCGLSPSVSGKGLVSGQNPAGGSVVRRGATVGIRASATSGTPAAVTVPDMRGLTIKRAGTVLQRLGLNFNPSGTGIASGQTPGPGEKVPPGTAINVRFTPPKE
ncbi:MAG: penicillin-binding transpeptidase domain-containing protein [Bacillota bacterium]